MSFVFGADRRPWSRRHVSILVLAVAVIAPMSGFESAQAVEIEPGKQVAATFDYENEEGEKSTLHYLIYVPGDYAENDRKIPFMLFLHGAGERGDDLNRVKAWGPPRQLKEGKALPMIVVARAQSDVTNVGAPTFASATRARRGR